MPITRKVKQLPPHENLGKELTDSLEPILETSSMRARDIITKEINKLNSAIIPNTDANQDKLIRYVLAIAREIPEVLNNNNSEMLKQLCIRCIDHLGLVDELKNRAKGNQSRHR